ncbi:hypothetical protein [Flavobacterium lindanitolerans]|uniref:hypothetical protein n=1 Tax=Flavobacterium lindanitolerans TaxID=428988 RepID=UPI002809D0CB|nr:hypothetical protein [Flavobacterium lindanitolerans]MDQ7961894.1 hypothetical protein [Flavobacterium lindanitolerans]
MEINWITIAIVVLIGLILIVFLMRRNLKDQKKVEKFFNEEYKAKPENESEVNDNDR